jgi:8-oxo-dGTP diphosphatase
MKRVDVAAAVLRRSDGSVLLGQRAEGTFYPGYWEFPGGKVEPGETPAQALVRELAEELEIAVAPEDVLPWVVREHVYPHAQVCLHFFRVQRWAGEPRARVHAALAWVKPPQQTVAPMLPANGPVWKFLALPQQMLVSGVAVLLEAGEPLAAAFERQEEALACARAQGPVLVQVREPAALAEALVRRLRPQLGAEDLLVVNGEVDAAQALGTGLHLPQRRLEALSGRPELPWVGASVHGAAALRRAEALGLDYAVLGPVRPTRSHPGAAALGWQGFEEIARGAAIPVYAIGGLGPADLEDARRAGAHGVAGIRAWWS